MGKLGTSLKAANAAGDDGACRGTEDLVRAFNEMRDGLVSTLWFILRNREGTR